jgi:hypothetical protein
MRYSGLTRRQVQKIIRELEGRGLVSTDLNEGGTLKTRDHERPNRYTLHLGGVAHDTPPVSPMTGAPVSPTTPEPSLEPSIEPEEPPYPPQAGEIETVPVVDIVEFSLFEQFWEQYPRHAGKPAASKAFKSALKRLMGRQGSTEGTLSLFEGLERWCEYWKARNEPNFVPYPATWLNQDRWDDFPPKIGQNGRDRVGKSNEALIRVVQRRKGLQ